MFVNVPPLQRTPLFATDAYHQKTLESEAIQIWNDELNARIKGVQGNVFTLDMHSLLTNVLDNYRSFGFSSNWYCLSRCEYSPGQYVWTNNFHPSATVHDLLAKQAASLVYDAK